VTNTELKVALRTLEARVNEQALTISALRQVVDSLTLPKPVAVEAKESGRKMCPKCGVKPNHFFHVKTCNGKQEEKINAEKVSPS
jgi:uncharacterized metal-binding protein YceD (DUF177 family)